MGFPPREVPEKRCLMCDTRLNRRRYPNGEIESPYWFLRRQFCSLHCANSRFKGGLSRKAFYNRARKFRKKQCEACGNQEARLHVHHVDENWKNNSPDNLQTLCSFCHQFWHRLHERLGLRCQERMPEFSSLWHRQHLEGLGGSEVMGIPFVPLRQWRLSRPIS